VSTTEAGRLTTPGEPGSPQRDGASLQAVMDCARRLDELSCARVVASIAEAVHAAQKSGPAPAVTPAAVLVRPDGSVALAPAVAVPAAASPRYTAPERLRGGAGDRRSDVFTLGVLLWEALAHEPLFAGEGSERNERNERNEAIRRAVLEAPIRPPSELNANVPVELDAICRRALARDPADRYQSARVMAADIEAVLGDAGYPESNEQIARFLAAMPATTPAPPAPPAKAADLLTAAPRAAVPAATLPLPASVAGHRAAAAGAGDEPAAVAAGASRANRWPANRRRCRCRR
jgi:serine/threonine-protein kinase